MLPNVGPQNASKMEATSFRVRRWFPTLAMIGFAALAPSQTAAAEPVACQPHSEALAHFARNYKELPKAAGLTDAGNLIEVLSTSNGSTWSIIITTPNGTSCLVAAGESWQELRQKTAEDTFAFRQ